MVVSALVFGQRLEWLRAAWVSQSVVPVVCRETVTELIRVLAYPKFRLDHTARDTLLAAYLPYTEAARLPDPLPAPAAICRDPDGVMFLQLAIAADVDALVSGDAALGADPTVVPVLSPSSLRERLLIARGSI